METHQIYEDIARRTGGDIYIGVVGPVRTGKSTFIKRFMETLVLPGIEDPYMRERARDELPQSGSGRTVMTAEPKFVPEEAVRVEAEGSSFSVRLIDCVGYMIPGALGQTEADGKERLVTTPWFAQPIPFSEAADLGTRKVITEHSTLGLLVTTDGSIADLPREAYVEAEERVAAELKALGKPFLMLLNCAEPGSAAALALRDELREKYGVGCEAVNCLALDEEAVSRIIRSVLSEFPLTRVEISLPGWVDALPANHPLKTQLFDALRAACAEARVLRDGAEAARQVAACPCVSRAEETGAEAGTGVCAMAVELPRELFFKTLSERSGFQVRDDGDLLELLTDMSGVKSEYDRVKDALNDVRTKGYGIVMPSREELRLAEPEIVRKGGRYGISLKASAPSIHMVLANIETEVSPALGSERQSEDLINYLLQEFEGDSGKIWESNIFGKSLYEIAGEGLQAKIKKMPEDAQSKLRETLQRVVNEGSGGLICILL